MVISHWSLVKMLWLRLRKGDRRQETGDIFAEIGLTICDLEFGICDFEFGIWDLKFVIWDLGFFSFGSSWRTWRFILPRPRKIRLSKKAEKREWELEQRSAKSNHPIYHYGIKNISGWGAKSQRKKWNFQRCRKTLTTKTQRHEVLVKRLREETEKENGRQFCGNWFGYLWFGIWVLEFGIWDFSHLAVLGELGGLFFQKK